jgi:hypothetical protein
VYGGGTRRLGPAPRRLPWARALIARRILNYTVLRSSRQATVSAEKVRWLRIDLIFTRSARWEHKRSA